MCCHVMCASRPSGALEISREERACSGCTVHIAFLLSIRPKTIVPQQLSGLEAGNFLSWKALVISAASPQNTRTAMGAIVSPFFVTLFYGVHDQY